MTTFPVHAVSPDGEDVEVQDPTTEPVRDYSQWERFCNLKAYALELQAQAHFADATAALLDPEVGRRAGDAEHYRRLGASSRETSADYARMARGEPVGKVG